MPGSGRSTMMVSYTLMGSFPRVLAMLTARANDRQGLLAAPSFRGARQREPGISRFRVRCFASPRNDCVQASHSDTFPRNSNRREFDAQIMDRAGGAGDVEPDQLRLQRDPDQR